MSYSDDSIENTKRQIRQLVGEIVQLSKSDLAPNQYYPAVLQRIVRSLAAVGGAVWLKGEGDGLQLVYQINLSNTLMDVQSEDGGKHYRLIEDIARRNQAQLIPFLPALSDEWTGGNPTRYLLVIAPIQLDDKAEGVIEIFQRPDAQPATQRGYLKFLQQMCEQIGEWLKLRESKLHPYSNQDSFQEQVPHFSMIVHGTLDLNETAYTIVNEGRRVIDCDRVSLALGSGRKTSIIAVSGHGTPSIKTLTDLASKVIATGEPLYYDGTTADLPPQLEDSLHAHIDKSYVKAIIVLPLRRPSDGERSDANRDEVGRDICEDGEVIGALIVEQVDNNVPPELLNYRATMVLPHVQSAIYSSYRSSMPVWKTMMVDFLYWIRRFGRKGVRLLRKLGRR